MLLKRSVALKVIVTEEFKKAYTEDLRRADSEISNAQQQLQFQADRVISEVARTNLEQATALRRQFDMERQKQERAKAEVMGEINKVTGLEIDSEFERGSLEGWVDINVGDNLEQKLGQAEIIIKDGVVTEIRE